MKVERFAYPRLSDGDTLVRLHQVSALAQTAPANLVQLAGAEHPNASPVATGAVIASPEQIALARETVVKALAQWLVGSPVPSGQTAQFDVALGQALHSAAALLPADAAHQGTWNFLSAVVFPDVVWTRFPDLHEDRFLGRPRNALRRAWTRYEVLGDRLVGSNGLPLGEDELVGLLERTSLARNRRLVRLLAAEVNEYRGSAARSEFARRMYKRATHVTGPLLLDALSDDDLRRLVQAIAEQRPWPADEPRLSINEVAQAQPGRHRRGLAGGEGSDADEHEKTPVDIVLEFHEQLLLVLTETEELTGYRPTRTLAIVEQFGGVEAARRIAGSPEPSETLESLRACGRLDLAVESLVADIDYRGLFTADLLALAQGKHAEARR